MRKIDLNNFQVARSETARDINRRIVLNLIRKNQPISRAGLARQSGLQRSTVSAITEQLIDERWVTEGAIGHVPRGRKPTFLNLNSDHSGIVGVDIHPGTTSLAVATLNGQFIAQESMSTGSDANEFLARLGRRINDLMRAHPRDSYEGIGVSLPGRIDKNTNRLIFAPSLGWGEVDIKTTLEKITGMPVELENAANACALAESWSGQHGEAVQNLVAVTVSEGLGVGMVMNGQLLKGSVGVAGEFGHVALVEGGVQCRCGNRGCWETLASNSAAVRFYTESTLQPSRKGHVGSKSNMARVTFEDLLRLAEQNDDKAHRALTQMAQHLGEGMAMLVSGLAPDVIVVVGNITRVWGKYGGVVEAAVHQRVMTHAATRIVPSNPDLQSRLKGTIALVLQKHFGAPYVA